MPSPRDRRATRALALLVAATLGTGLVAVGAGADPGTTYTTRQFRLLTAAGVTLDATLFVPSTATREHPAPAVVIGHGFGGSKRDVRADAADLARHGYVVLTPTARGFGASTGQIGLDLPEYDGKDLSATVDYLADQPMVRLDGPGDPRVAVAGASYGGGLALVGASHDDRIDAVAAVITWNSLATALLPNAADPEGGRGEPGVFKQAYAGALFGSGASRPGAEAAACGRFAADVCAAYADVSAGGASPATRALLDRASVASRLGAVRAPTLLIQGEDDTLFPLAEAVRTYQGLRAQGAPVAMVWAQGGHDAPFGKAGESTIRARTLAWFDHYLRGSRRSAGPAFTWYEPTTGRVGTAARYPVTGTRTTTFGLAAGGVLRTGPTDPAAVQQLANPPGGEPSAVSSVPGLGGFGGLAGGLLSDPPSQTASWTSAPLTADLNLVGAASLRVHLSSSTGSAVLFAKLYDVGSDGAAQLPSGQVAPLRVTGLGPAGRDVVVTLPTLAHTFATGHRVRISFVATDRAYLGDRGANVIRIRGTALSGLSVPSAPSPSGGRGLLWAVAVGVLLAAGLATLSRVVTVRVRRASAAHEGEPDATPIVVRGLTKVYGDGNRAVDDVSFAVERGQIVGLLGPNGSGKTTTLRMALGLITPTAGGVELYGERVRPGAPVMRRFGTFVEGPGLLPHLSGRDNLQLWWRSTGAALVDAHLDEALEVAGLGAAVDKPVRSYSHGMRQRLALAQALLGKPDCLILDEPTNGLDPPQIREMRELIRGYAAQGKTVLLSSHLLSEVEVTCTHAVVMQSGRVIHHGPVSELLALGAQVHISVGAQPLRAAAVLGAVRGVRAVTDVGGGDLVVDAPATMRPVLVRALVEAGLDVVEVSVRSRLEDVFLDLVGATAVGHAVGSGGEG
ncbi:MAG: type transport system ATP-binding protein [Frankiales bacterium]|nr:type transport system ATP-binding protein [Frankiales bacterium]